MIIGFRADLRRKFFGPWTTGRNVRERCARGIREAYASAWHGHLLFLLLYVVWLLVQSRVFNLVNLGRGSSVADEQTGQDR